VRKKQIVGLGRTAEILAWNKNQVLKLFRDDWSRSAVKWEEKIARMISEAGLPVPAVYGIIEVDGRHGILYEHVDGQSMLDAFLTKPEELEHFAKLFAGLHVKMHSIRIRGLPFQRQQLEKKIRNARPLSERSRNAALETLHQLPDDNVLCHGDFHPDNILMSSQGPIVIDWNDATQGNSYADIARTLLLLNPPRSLIEEILRVQPKAEFDIEQVLSSIKLFTDIYLRQYTQMCSVSLENVKSWQLPVAAARLSEGIKEEESQLLSIVKALSNAISL